MALAHGRSPSPPRSGPLPDTLQPAPACAPPRRATPRGCCGGSGGCGGGVLGPALRGGEPRCLAASRAPPSLAGPSAAPRPVCLCQASGASGASPCRGALPALPALPHASEVRTFRGAGSTGCADRPADLRPRRVAECRRKWMLYARKCRRSAASAECDSADNSASV